MVCPINGCFAMMSAVESAVCLRCEARRNMLWGLGGEMQSVECLHQTASGYPRAARRQENVSRDFFN